jgi:hypothetical protein
MDRQRRLTLVIENVDYMAMLLAERKAGALRNLPSARCPSPGRAGRLGVSEDVAVFVLRAA